MIDLPPPEDQLTRAAWAKSDRYGIDWFPLYAHLDDTAAVADQLFDSWFSESQLTHLAETFGSPDIARRLAVWIAAAHDVGKATSAFAMKVREYRSRLEAAGFVFPPLEPTPEEQRRYPHGYAGQRAVTAHLRSKMQGSDTPKGLSRIAEIIGGHHGVFPAHTVVAAAFGVDEHGSWRTARTALLDRADRRAEIGDDLWRSIAVCRVPETAQALLTGFLITCDWIASNEDLFPYSTNEPASLRAKYALQELAFGEHWQPQQIGDAASYFAQRFALPGPRPVQHDAIALVGELTESSLVLVEAPTGEGKTEAGFACAEALAARFGTHGFACLLPTRATTNAMFARVLGWIRSAGESRDETVTVSLAHAKAEFEESYQSLFKGGRAHNMYDDAGVGDAAIGNLWFCGRKQRALADFSVGTIDQLLFMALKAKHLALRHLGFSGKIIVIDEVHAADAFMRSYLLRALEWLGAYQVPVVALSATLPPRQRAELLAAYRRGAQHRRGALAIGDDEDVEEGILTLSDTVAYPLITAVGATATHQRTPARSDRQKRYRIESVEEEDLVDAVLTEAEAGGCIAVVLDTVDRAQRAFEAIAARTSRETQLFHSRFTVESRNQREQELIVRLGKNAPHRPKSLIVVATQVIESSLDVDFDLMFTDIAPMDLLIQRMGRVHRHERAMDERPESMREARIILSGGSAFLAPGALPEFERGVQKVYGDANLLRTVATLRARFEERREPIVEVPSDVPLLVAECYSETFVPPSGWEERIAIAEKERRDHERDQRERSRQFRVAPPGVGNIIDWSRLSYSEASEEQIGAAQVRDADISLEVVLVYEREGRSYSLPWLANGLGDELVDLDTGIDSQLARAVAECTVSLPAWLTLGSNLERALDDLEQNGFEGWQQSPWLRGMLPLVLDENLAASVGKFRVRYDQQRGMLVDGTSE